MAMHTARLDETGELYLEALPCRRLAERFGTPVLVYSRRRLAANAAAIVAAFRHHWPRSHAFFAVKACYYPDVLRTVAAAGLGAELLSELEFRLAASAGIAPPAMLWNGPGKTDAELALALTAGVTLIADSLAELQRLDELAAAAGMTAVPVGLRVAVDMPGFAGPAFKLGTPVAGGEAAQLLRQAAGLRHLRPVGLHLHNYAMQVTPTLHAAGLRAMVDLALQLRAETGLTLEFLDMGGGLAPRSLLEQAGGSAEQFARAAAAELVRLPHAPALYLEPGRYVAADAGVAVTRVVRRKHAGGRDWLLVDAATNTLVPDAFSCYQVVPAQPIWGETAPFAVGDGICTPQGVLDGNAALPARTDAGHLLAVLNCGAYTTTFAHPFVYPVAPVVLVDGDQAHVLSPGLTPAAQARTLLGGR